MILHLKDERLSSPWPALPHGFQQRGFPMMLTQLRRKPTLTLPMLPFQVSIGFRAEQSVCRQTVSWRGRRCLKKCLPCWFAEKLGNPSDFLVCGAQKQKWGLSAREWYEAELCLDQCLSYKRSNINLITQFLCAKHCANPFRYSISLTSVDAETDDQRNP